MKKCFIVVGLCVLCSCATPPKSVVRTIVDLNAKTPDFNKIVIVNDVGKQYGRTFGESFVQNLKSLTKNSDREVSIIPYIEFIRSSYNDQGKKNTFSDTLFVFINGHGVKSDGYGVSSVKYQMNVQFLDQDPFVSQEIEVGVLSSFWSSKSERAVEFAQTIFDQLQSRNLL